MVPYKSVSLDFSPGDAGKWPELWAFESPLGDHCVAIIERPFADGRDRPV